MPECTPLFIDKLALTLPIRRQSVRDYIDELLLHNDTIGERRLVREGWSPYYSIARAIEFATDCKVLLQASPTNFRRRRAEMSDPEGVSDDDSNAVTHRGRLRIEWNPSRMDEIAGATEEFRSMLADILGGEMQRELDRARITRIDLATDVRRLPIENIAVSRSDIAVSSAIYYGRDGRPQTVYLGAKDSDVRYVIYDKRAQRRGRVRSLSRALTRIEARIKDANSVGELLRYPNPFDALTVREYVALQVGDRRNADYRWEWFLDSIKRRGLQAATALAPGRSRYNLRSRIHEREPPVWWKPGELWEGLPDAIERLGLFDFRNDWGI